jgi:hypothetical protein
MPPRDKQEGAFMTQWFTEMFEFFEEGSVIHIIIAINVMITIK